MCGSVKTESQNQWTLILPHLSPASAVPEHPFHKLVTFVVWKSRSCRHIERAVSLSDKGPVVCVVEINLTTMLSAVKLKSNIRDGKTSHCHYIFIV
jgi:hypothetical protein